MKNELKLTVQEILDLDTVETKNILDSEVLSKICNQTFFNAIFTSQVKEKFEVKLKTNDYHGDGRWRKLFVVCFEEEPIFIYQDIGKGSIEEIKIINKKALEVALEFLSQIDFWQSMKELELNETSKEERIIIHSYNGLGLKVENNQLVVEKPKKNN